MPRARIWCFRWRLDIVYFYCRPVLLLAEALRCSFCIWNCCGDVCLHDRAWIYIPGTGSVVLYGSARNIEQICTRTFPCSICDSPFSVGGARDSSRLFFGVCSLCGLRMEGMSDFLDVLFLVSLSKLSRYRRTDGTKDGVAVDVL